MQNKKIKIAVNGCGRIGRAFLKLIMENKNVDVVAVNDLGSVENIAYLLKYDSAYGVSDLEISFDKSSLIINGNKIKFLREKDPANLPWKELNVDIVVESTGVFANYEKSQLHINAGAKRVVITAPVKEKTQNSKTQRPACRQAGYQTKHKTQIINIIQ